MSLFGLDLPTLLTLCATLAAAGAVTGALAGLFGVGGGAIIVPVLYEAFGWMGAAEEVRMPLAVGTSLAIILPTSVASARAHFAHGEGDKALVRAWAVPVLLGVLLGAAIARVAEPWVFKLVFVGVAGATAARLLRGARPPKVARRLPGGPLLSLYGGIVGLLSSLMGIGGGAISNLILTFHGRDIRQAVSTSAAVGALIAVPGAIGYALAGWDKPGLPPDAIGYVSPLAFALVAPTSLLVAPYGARLAHRMPKRRLEVLFGCFLLAASARFLFDLATG